MVTRWALVMGGVVTNIVTAPAMPAVGFGGTWVQDADALAVMGGTYVSGAFGPPDTPADAAEWLIDVGSFFDRFGAARMAVLTSDDAIVRALVTDIRSRHWVDLQRADVAAGIDLIIAAGVPGVDADLKTAILTATVTAPESLALRRLFFR